MSHCIKNNKFAIIGLVFTQLIHCFWPYGKDSVFALIVANCIGRCGLFLFIIWLGDYIRIRHNKKTAMFRVYNKIL